LSKAWLCGERATKMEHIAFWVTAMWVLVVCVLRALKNTGGAGARRLVGLDVSAFGGGKCAAVWFDSHMCPTQTLQKITLVHDVCIFFSCILEISASGWKRCMTTSIVVGDAAVHHVDKHIPCCLGCAARAPPRLPLPVHLRCCFWRHWSLTLAFSPSLALSRPLPSLTLPFFLHICMYLSRAWLLHIKNQVCAWRQLCSQPI
jgi:hypothetical protein